MTGLRVKLIGVKCDGCGEITALANEMRAEDLCPLGCLLK